MEKLKKKISNLTGQTTYKAEFKSIIDFQTQLYKILHKLFIIRIINVFQYLK